MSRQYVVQEWSNAAADSYTGYQVNKHFRKNGSAAIESYADEEPVKKAKKVKAPDFRSSNERAEDRLDARRIQFEKAFEVGLIDFDRYNMLLTEWEIARAKLDKKMGIVEDSKEVEPKSSRPSIMPIIEDAAKSFCARHPFAFTVASILFGCGILNIAGIAG